MLGPGELVPRPGPVYLRGYEEMVDLFDREHARFIDHTDRWLAEAEDFLLATDDAHFAWLDEWWKETIEAHERALARTECD